MSPVKQVGQEQVVERQSGLVKHDPPFKQGLLKAHRSTAKDRRTHIHFE